MWRISTPVAEIWSSLIKAIEPLSADVGLSGSDHINREHRNDAEQYNGGATQQVY